MKNLTPMDSLVGSWLIWLSAMAAQTLPLLQWFSFASAGLLSCIGIYIAIKNRLKNGKNKRD
jgi:hypothetical protein